MSTIYNEQNWKRTLEKDFVLREQAKSFNVAENPKEAKSLKDAFELYQAGEMEEKDFFKKYLGYNTLPHTCDLIGICDELTSFVISLDYAESIFQESSQNTEGS